VTVGRGGGGVNFSTTTIRSSNGNPMAAGSDLGPTGLDLGPAVFFKFDFWCRLVTADTKNRFFLYRIVGISYSSSRYPKYIFNRYDKPFL
jgi:hypothetical protein